MEVLCSCCALLSCKNKQAEANPADQVKAFPVATMAIQDVELQASYPAVLKGQEDIDIKARVEGYIDAIYVDEGATVRKGQPLFKILTLLRLFRQLKMRRLIIIQLNWMWNVFAHWLKKEFLVK